MESSVHLLRTLRAKQWMVQPTRKAFNAGPDYSKVLILYFNIYFIVFYQFKLFVFSAKIRIFGTDLRQGYKGYRYFPSLGLTNILIEMFSSIRETWKLV